MSVSDRRSEAVAYQDVLDSVIALVQERDGTLLSRRFDAAFMLFNDYRASFQQSYDKRDTDDFIVFGFLDTALKAKRLKEAYLLTRSYIKPALGRVTLTMIRIHLVFGITLGFDTMFKVFSDAVSWFTHPASKHPGKFSFEDKEHRDFFSLIDQCFSSLTLYCLDHNKQAHLQKLMHLNKKLLEHRGADLCLRRGLWGRLLHTLLTVCSTHSSQFFTIFSSDLVDQAERLVEKKVNLPTSVLKLCVTLKPSSVPLNEAYRIQSIQDLLWRRVEEELPFGLKSLTKKSSLTVHLAKQFFSGLKTENGCVQFYTNTLSNAQFQLFQPHAQPLTALLTKLADFLEHASSMDDCGEELQDFGSLCLHIQKMGLNIPDIFVDKLLSSSVCRNDTVFMDRLIFVKTIPGSKVPDAAFHHFSSLEKDSVYRFMSAGLLDVDSDFVLPQKPVAIEAEYEFL